MIGIECEKDASEIISRCMARGVLVIKAKNKLRLLPALNIPWKLLQKAMNIIKEECER
jgi:acetylornithine/N-succinyldiaminopimelate aminotransferase